MFRTPEQIERAIARDERLLETATGTKRRTIQQRIRDRRQRLEKLEAETAPRRELAEKWIWHVLGRPFSVDAKAWDEVPYAADLRHQLVAVGADPDDVLSFALANASEGMIDFYRRKTVGGKEV